MALVAFIIGVPVGLRGGILGLVAGALLMGVIGIVLAFSTDQVSIGTAIVSVLVLNFTIMTGFVLRAVRQRSLTVRVEA